MKNLYKIEDELYIVSNTENVSENCWIITSDRLVQLSYLLSDEVAKGFKVILTTNKLLIKDGIQAIDDEFLEWFMKNPSCEEVEVDYNSYKRGKVKSSCYKIIILTVKEFGLYDESKEIKFEDIFNDEKREGIKKLIQNYKIENEKLKDEINNKY